MEQLARVNKKLNEALTNQEEVLQQMNEKSKKM